MAADPPGNRAAILHSLWSIHCTTLGLLKLTRPGQVTELAFDRVPDSEARQAPLQTNGTIKLLRCPPCNQTFSVSQAPSQL